MNSQKTQQPTDEEIFNHMMPDDRYCGACGSDAVEEVDRDYYIAQRCQDCHFECEPKEEQ